MSCIVSVPLKCVTPVSIPIFQQEEAVRDIKRLCETIAPYEGGIFAPLKLLKKSDANLLRGEDIPLLDHHPTSVFRALGGALSGASYTSVE